MDDGNKAMQLYISKLNPKSDAFFQYPKKQWNYDDDVWYDARPIGVNKLDNMMKSISEAAKLSKMYTNHQRYLVVKCRNPKSPHYGNIWSP